MGRGIQQGQELGLPEAQRLAGGIISPAYVNGFQSGWIAGYPVGITQAEASLAAE